MKQKDKTDTSIRAEFSFPPKFTLKEMTTTELMQQLNAMLCAATFTSNPQDKYIIAEIESRLHQGARAMKALHDLTAGGSEFVGDIDTCVKYIKGRQHYLHNLVIEKVMKIKELERKNKNG